jgi:hypothetical protein
LSIGTEPQVRVSEKCFAVSDDPGLPTKGHPFRGQSFRRGYDQK